jgi:hypothetical protein
MKYSFVSRLNISIFKDRQLTPAWQIRDKPVGVLASLPPAPESTENWFLLTPADGGRGVGGGFVPRLKKSGGSGASVEHGLYSRYP